MSYYDARGVGGHVTGSYPDAFGYRQSKIPGWLDELNHVRWSSLPIILIRLRPSALPSSEPCTTPIQSRRISCDRTAGRIWKAYERLSRNCPTECRSWTYALKDLAALAVLHRHKKADTSGLQGRGQVSPRSQQP